MDETSEAGAKRTRVRRTGAGMLLAVGIFAAGIVFATGFHWTLAFTNSEGFCLSCHEMKDNNFAEYRNTVHYSNRTGVGATCHDCHVPVAFSALILRKIEAANDLYGHLQGSIATPERFAAKRLELARREWRRMKAGDSRECRNCHEFGRMDYAAQESRASKAHQEGLTGGGKTCIDCHQGIAHKLPANAQEEYRKAVQ